MTEDNATEPAIENDDAAKPGDDATSTPAIATEPVKPAAKTSRSKVTVKTDDEPKHKCGACGHEAVFRVKVSVGGRDVLIHGCASSEKMLFDYMRATHVDPNAPVPAFIAGK